MIDQIANGRTDLVFEYLAAGHPADSTDANGVSLIKWCSYYGDVSALRHLMASGEVLGSLGDNFDLNGAVFHGHWRLCEFLVERGADVNYPHEGAAETPLHAALCKTERPDDVRILKILLTNGANPNVVTREGAPTGAFMRDSRTRGETPLHRAAAFGTEESIELLVDAGAIVEAKDMNGDSPLTWASWYHRPPAILRKLCYGEFRIHPDAR